VSAAKRPKFCSRTVLIAIAALVLMSSAQVVNQQQSPQTHPSRIVSLIPAVTEMLFAIGAGKEVVGVSSFDHYPPEVEKIERIGALLDPDLERILALRPDLAVVYGSQTDLKAQLERAKIPMFIYSHAGLPDVTVTMRALGARVGRAKEAERAAATVEAAIADVKRRVSGRSKPRVLLVFGRESGALRGIYASGGVGFLNDMLETAGGVNVFADVARQSVQATTELILARRPEVIVELRSSPATDEELRVMRRDWDSLQSVPAVRNKRIYLIADERLIVPGPRIADGTRLLASTLHPEALR
jgi:iron complex transport system substrate-binding protein